VLLDDVAAAPLVEDLSIGLLESGVAGLEAAGVFGAGVVGDD
jgi:hypothetical protein